MPETPSVDDYLKVWFTYLRAFQKCCSYFNTSTPTNLAAFATQSPATLVPGAWHGQLSSCVYKNTGLYVPDASLSAASMQALLETVYRPLSEFVVYVFQRVAGPDYTHMSPTDFDDLLVTSVFPDSGTQQALVKAMADDVDQDWFPPSQVVPLLKLLSDRKKKVNDAVGFIAKPPASTAGGKSGGNGGEQ